MGFIDGIRLAELARDDGSDLNTALGGLVPVLQEAASKAVDDRTAWLQSVTRALRPQIGRVDDPRADGLLGTPSTHTPRRRYRPPAGLREWMIRWLSTASSAASSAERAAVEIAELEAAWGE